jgi:hypothetical protein
MRRSSASRCSAITLAVHRRRDARLAASALRPAAVIETRRRRPWPASSRRVTWPCVSSAATIVPIDCGVIASARAKSAVVAGPSASRRFNTDDCGYGSAPPGTASSAEPARTRRRNATVISRSSSARSSGVGLLLATKRMLPGRSLPCKVNFYASFPSSRTASRALRAIGRSRLAPAHSKETGLPCRN